MANRGSLGPDPIDVGVGARIRIRRQALGMSQVGLAEQLGVSFQQVQKYERGSNRISASMLVRTARALNCPPSQLIGEDPEGGGFDQDQDHAGAAELLSLVAAHGAADLLRAFARVPDSQTRSAVISIVRGLVGSSSDCVAKRADSKD
jgi:transcriptional regulator with XRE-family HTH domain